MLLHFIQKKLFIFSLFFALFNLKGLLLQAQNTQTGEKLTIAAAINKALAQNFEILIVQEQAKVANYNNHWANTAKYPTINFALAQNNLLNNIIKPAPFQLQGIIINNGIVPSINLNWVLFNGFGIHIAKQRLALLEQQTQGNVALAIQNTIQNVLLGYYQIKVLEAQTQLSKQVLQLSKQKYDYVQFKKQIGGATANEVWVEQSNYLTDSVALLTQEVQLRNAVRNLNWVMAEKEIEKNYQFADSLQTDFPTYQFEDLQSKLLSNNPTYRNQLLAQELLQNNIAATKAMLSPTLSLAATSTYSWAFQNLDNARQIDGTSAGNRTGSIIGQNNAAGFTLNVPIFGGGLLKRNVQEAKMEATIGMLQTEQLKFRLEFLVRQTLDQYQTRKNLYQLAYQNQQLAFKNLNLAYEKFKTGKINTFEYRILQENYFNTATTTFNTLQQVLDSHTQLATLTGSILEMK